MRFHTRRHPLKPGDLASLCSVQIIVINLDNLGTETLSLHVVDKEISQQTMPIIIVQYSEWRMGTGNGEWGMGNGKWKREQGMKKANGNREWKREMGTETKNGNEEWKREMKKGNGNGELKRGMATESGSGKCKQNREHEKIRGKQCQKCKDSLQVIGI